MAHADHRLRIEGFRRGGDVCLRFGGHLTIADCEDAARVFDSALAAGPAEASSSGEARIFISMRELEYIDSSGLATLIRLNAKALSAGRRFGIVLPSTKIAPVFKLTRMDSMLKIAEGGEAEALLAEIERPEHALELPAPRALRSQAA